MHALADARESPRRRRARQNVKSRPVPRACPHLSACTCTLHRALSLSLSIYIYIYAYIYIYILIVCLHISLYLHPSIFPSFYMSISLSLSFFIFLLISFYTFMSLYVSLCLFVSLCVSLFLSMPPFCLFTPPYTSSRLHLSEDARTRDVQRSGGFGEGGADLSYSNTI